MFIFRCLIPTLSIYFSCEEFVWISILFSPHLQPGLSSMRYCVNFLKHIFSLLSLLVEHIGLLHTALSSCPMILNILLLTIAGPALSFFIFLCHVLLNILNFLKLVWGLKNRAILFLLGNMTNIFPDLCYSITTTAFIFPA